MTLVALTVLISTSSSRGGTSYPAPKTCSIRYRNQNRDGSSGFCSSPTFIVACRSGVSKLTIPVRVSATVVSFVTLSGCQDGELPPQYSQTAVTGGVGTTKSAPTPCPSWIRSAV